LPCERLLPRIILESVRFKNLLEDSSHSDFIEPGRLRGLAPIWWTPRIGA
jgi:hypothetical protein